MFKVDKMPSPKQEVGRKEQMLSVSTMYVPNTASGQGRSWSLPPGTVPIPSQFMQGSKGSTAWGSSLAGGNKVCFTEWRKPELVLKQQEGLSLAEMRGTSKYQAGRCRTPVSALPEPPFLPFRKCLSSECGCSRVTPVPWPGAHQLSGQFWAEWFVWASKELNWCRRTNWRR